MKILRNLGLCLFILLTVSILYWASNIENFTDSVMVLPRNRDDKELYHKNRQNYATEQPRKYRKGTPHPTQTPSGPGKFVLTNSYFDDAVNDQKALIKTIDSRGDYSEVANEKIVYSRQKLACMSPAVYNPTINACDCSFAGEYVDGYGCLSKCEEYQKYIPGPDKNTLGSCVNLCDMSNNQYWDVSLNKCFTCPIGTWNDGNNHCIPLNPCPSNGKYIDNSRACQFCPVGQVFDDNDDCVNVCADYEIYENGICLPKCPYSYQYYDSDATQSCLNCEPGYFNDGANNCAPGPACPEGQSYNDNFVCASVCPDYERWNSFSSSCVPKCNYNQFFNQANLACNDCPQGKQGDGMYGCVPIPVTPAPTPNCGWGQKVDPSSNRCVSYCPYWSTNDVFNPTLCEKICALPNQIYDLSINNACIDCSVGYLADDYNQCTLCDTANGYQGNPKGGVPCTPTCTAWQYFQQGVCNARCPNPNTNYSATAGCQYCPIGTLVNTDNTCSLCDTKNGYVGQGPDHNQAPCFKLCNSYQEYVPAMNGQAAGCINLCTAPNTYFENTTYYTCMHCPAGKSISITADGQNQVCQ